ncbi:MAG TPA: RsmB/NOP family class I SAM-dependent RNA methyltransferase [Patescibacteria group bacterium]|nr:RsmB/NOP family class I SAM-dependent RNA methyltransferase [Patescibacteria group bacterium]
MKNPWDTLPEKFVQKLTLLTGEKKSQQILESFCNHKPPTFRANTLKITADELEKNLKDEGFHIQRVEWYPNAFILLDQPQKLLTATKWYLEGYLYVQSLSSMIPPLVLDPQKDDLVLDLTAAPGSKTTQIAAMMENSGTIIANDKSRIRLFKLVANLKLQGVTNTQVLQIPGQFLWKKFPQYFDKILVDAPCSMEGRFVCDSPKSYTDWSPRKVEFLEEQQKFLMRSAVSATRKGGIIVYSTCTLSPEENEAVVDWILKKDAGKIQLIDITSPTLPSEQGITSWKNKIFDESLKKTIRIFPTDTMEGFFIAKFQKIA